MTQPKPTETYLGDAVYASCDGWHIWLRTGDGQDQQIALEPNVFLALLEYAISLRGAYGASIEHAYRLMKS